MAKKNWIAKALAGSSKGALHKATGTPEGETIPAKKMEGAAKSKSGKVRRMASLAKTLESFKK